MLPLARPGGSSTRSRPGQRRATFTALLDRQHLYRIKYQKGAQPDNLDEEMTAAETTSGATRTASEFTAVIWTRPPRGSDLPSLGGVVRGWRAAGTLRALSEGRRRIGSRGLSAPLPEAVGADPRGVVALERELPLASDGSAARPRSVNLTIRRARRPGLGRGARDRAARARLRAW